MELLGIDIIFQGKNLERLLIGMYYGLRIAIISFILGGALGIILGIIRVKTFKFIQIILRFYLEAFRIIPILVWLYLLYFMLPADFNIEINETLVSIIVFSLWIGAEISEIVRSSIISLPKHQEESGKALGLNRVQLYRYIFFSQGIKRAIPSFINLITRVIKTTSILIMIGIVEIIKVGQQIIEVYNVKSPTASFWIYGIILIIYFIVCYPLSKISKKLEAKWSIEG